VWSLSGDCLDEWIHPEGVLALTATAPEHVAADIMQRLRIGTVSRSGGWHRPNLHLRVRSSGDGAGDTASDFAVKCREIAQLLTEHSKGSAIVYVSTQWETERLAEQLNAELDERVVAYHAG
jgi:superfamily II DNA helicase RecQ